ncbi:MAG: hypothetical protein U1E17_08340 [Geminicoccaceae bacterium]
MPATAGSAGRSRRHALSVAALAGISLYEPEELVMAAGASTPLAQIEAELAERGQELAFEPADYGAVLGGAAGGQTIGGVIACNLAGPRRLKAGRRATICWAWRP